MSEYPASNNEAVNPYEGMFREPDPVDLSELTAYQETEKDPRVEELFAPRLTHGEKPKSQRTVRGDPEFYRRLLLGEDVVLDEEPTDYTERTHQKYEDEKYVPEPTEGQKLQAFFALRAAKESDPYLEAIIDKYIVSAGDMPDPSAEADEMRTNPDLRYEVGSYLLRDKLPRLKREQPHAVPERVFIGKQKSPHKLGYRHLGTLKSDEYSAMLAVAMLDGTFEDPGIGDPIELNEYRQPAQGQHRAAALLLLDRSHEYAPKPKDPQ